MGFCFFFFSELPGFYYDEEKNRYFPIKGPIPGAKSSSSSRTKQKPDPKPEQVGLLQISTTYEFV